MRKKANLWNGLILVMGIRDTTEIDSFLDGCLHIILQQEQSIGDLRFGKPCPKLEKEEQMRISSASLLYCRPSEFGQDFPVNNQNPKAAAEQSDMMKTLVATVGVAVVENLRLFSDEKREVKQPSRYFISVCIYSKAFTQSQAHGP